MRVLMLDDVGVIEAINKFMVPVKLISPDLTLPDRPAFAPARRYLENVPFARTNFAWYMVTDPLAQTILGCDPEVLSKVTAGKEAFEIQEFLDLLNRAKRILEIGEPPADPELAAELKRLLEESRQQVWETGTLATVRDSRMMTIWWLSKQGGRPLSALVRRLASDPDLFVPGVANLVVASLGEIVTTDRPFLPVHEPTVRRLVASDARDRELPEAERTWTEGVVPLVFRRKAAEAMETALGMRLHDPNESVVEGAARWWREHCDDFRFQERPPTGDYRLLVH